MAILRAGPWMLLGGTEKLMADRRDWLPVACVYSAGPFFRLNVPHSTS